MSTSTTETIEAEYIPKFKELNSEKLKSLCSSLDKISCQNEIIPYIASTILQCRSGMVRLKERLRSPKIKEETWFFFLGAGSEGKERIAKELASLVFGPYSDFVSISIEFSSSSDIRRKRSRLDASPAYLKRFAGAIQDNPHRVFLLEDVEQLHHDSRIRILNVIRTGTMQSATGYDICVSDAIIIFSCEKFDSRERSCSPVKLKFSSDEEKEDAGFDLNLNTECGDGDRSFDDVGIL